MTDFMKELITIEEAVSLWLLNKGNESAIFSADLYRFLYFLRREKSYRGSKIKGIRVNTNLQKKFDSVVDYLEWNHLIESFFRRKYFLIKEKDDNPFHVICSLYPEGYISYLSAMQFYNFTNRFSKEIHFTAPSRKRWKETQEKYIKENDIFDNNLPGKRFQIPYPSERLKIINKRVRVYNRATPYEIRNKSGVRVIGVGGLFIEMFKYPELCGGITHVVEVFDNMGSILSDEIISTVNEQGAKLDKCRFGFLFEKRLGIIDDRIDLWKGYAPSRGGSSKMVANLPYENFYDVDWSISLNHPIFNEKKAD